MNKSDIQTLCVFCSASDKVVHKYGHVIAPLVAFFKSQGWSVVYGGGSGGLMGALADECLAQGVPVIGVIPETLKDREVAHTGLNELIVTNDLQARQAKMAALSNAFLILPGGMGTMAEFFEVLTWSQLSLHHKPSFVLNINGYWQGMLQQLDAASDQGFMHQKSDDFLYVEETVDDLISMIESL